MDWKPYYQAERAAQDAREAIASWLVADAAVAEAVARRDVLSFPHTALRYAGPLQSRVVRALYDDRSVRRVVALGVLHGAGLAPYRTALDPAAARGAREEAFALVSGAFLVPGASVAHDELETAFGALPLLAGNEADGVRVDRTSLLKAEFSLDTFASILRAAADALGRPPLPILPLYVGMTRNPTTGSFGVAERVADWVRRHADAATAVVATGDLVHYGSAYGGAWASDDARSAAALERLLRSEVERALGLAFAERDWEQAYRLSNERIRNDQREMLAVLSAYLGEGASASVLAFELSDYSKILAAASPCVVASALVDYRREWMLRPCRAFRTLSGA